MGQEECSIKARNTMASSGRTIVYINGEDPRVSGADYKGNFPDKPLAFWHRFGAEHNQKWMYKGYRYYDNGTDSVIVFTLMGSRGRESLTPSG